MNELAEGRRMTAGSAVSFASVTRHVTDRATQPGNRMIRRAKISDRHNEVLNSAHDVCVN